jgi:putative ABC transport system substrate-binding protein
MGLNGHIAQQQSPAAHVGLGRFLAVIGQAQGQVWLDAAWVRVMRRREFITLLGGAASWPLAAVAQQSLRVIGFLDLGSLEARGHELTEFRQGLSEAGYVEGQSVAIEYRSASEHYDQLPRLAADLILRPVAVLVAVNNGSALAAKAATNTIPIVFAVNDDPVKLGLVVSLSKTGGNATGVNYLNSELEAKRLGLVDELVPKEGLIAVLINPSNPLAELVTKELQVAAGVIGRRIAFFNESNSREIDTAFAMLVQRSAAALLLAPDGMFNKRRVQIVTLATRYAVPAIYQWREYTEIGGLMSYGADRAEMFRQLGIYTGKILRGAKPADLPVWQPTKFH